MGIKLIATDLDGTFLDDEKNIPPENMAALRECAERNIEIVPATGRIAIGLPDEIKELPGVRYAITVNGAEVFDFKENRVISSCLMPVETALDLLMIARESSDDIMYDAYLDGIGIMSEDLFRELERFSPSPAITKLIRKTRRTVPDNIAYIKEKNRDVQKVSMLFLSEDARVRMRRRLAGYPGILVSSSLPNNLEINAEGAEKGGALLRLAEHLGLKREEVMAFGDGENDLTMVRAAGLGVAMENGNPEVKAAADYVTGTNNEAGVAAAIRRFVLK